MKKLIFIGAMACLLAALPQGMSAQAKIKVLDQSAKKVPSWVNSSQTDYIITSAMDKDLETAKQKCLDNVRKYIIESVAQNVKSTSTGNISQTTFNNEIVNFLDEYKSTFQTEAASVPFLKGVSASKIDAYYWEKQQNKSTKEITYLYSIRYPFPSLELKKMVHEFENRDTQIWNKCQMLAMELDNVTSLEQIDRAIADLGPIIDYLFDDVRKNEAVALRENYRKLYNSISFRTVSQTLGEYRFQLVLDERIIATSQRVTLKSECATQMTAQHEDAVIVVRYDYSGCSYDDENSVKATLRIGGKAVTHEFFFKIKKYAVEIWPEKTVYLTAAEKSDSTLSDIGIRVFIKSKEKVSYTVNTLTIEVPGLSEPLFLDNLNTTFKAAESTLNITWIGTVGLNKAQGFKMNMLRGNMEIEVPSEGIVKRIDFSLPFKPNW